MSDPVVVALNDPLPVVALNDPLPAVVPSDILLVHLSQADYDALKEQYDESLANAVQSLVDQTNIIINEALQSYSTEIRTEFDDKLDELESQFNELLENAGNVTFANPEW